MIIWVLVLVPTTISKEPIVNIKRKIFIKINQYDFFRGAFTLHRMNSLKLLPDITHPYCFFYRHIPHRPSIWIWIHSIQSIEESIAISIEQEEHQKRATRPRHRNRIQRDKDLWDLKNNYEEDFIDFEEYCRRVRKISYDYLSKIDKEK